MTDKHHIATNINRIAKWIMIPIIATVGVGTIYLLSFPVWFSLTRKTTNTYSNSIAESKNNGSYICSYNEISRQLEPPDSKYVPNIKEAFIEHQYHYKSKYTWNDDYVIVDSLLELILIFEIDSITHLNKDSNWNINNFHGSMPRLTKTISTDTLQNLTPPDTVILNLVIKHWSTEDSMTHQIPLGIIKLKRVD